MPDHRLRRWLRCRRCGTSLSSTSSKAGFTSSPLTRQHNKGSGDNDCCSLPTPHRFTLHWGLGISPDTLPCLGRLCLCLVSRQAPSHLSRWRAWTYPLIFRRLSVSCRLLNREQEMRRLLGSRGIRSLQMSRRYRLFSIESCSQDPLRRLIYP